MPSIMKEVYMARNSEERRCVVYSSKTVNTTENGNLVDQPTNQAPNQ